MTNKDEARCEKCGRPVGTCFCDLFCEHCGEPPFVCKCDESYDFCGGGSCALDDDASYHEVTICMICEAVINDDAMPGDGIYFCENCGDAICPDCAQPAVDEAGEIVFVCVTCIDKNRTASRG